MREAGLKLGKDLQSGDIIRLGVYPRQIDYILREARGGLTVMHRQVAWSIKPNKKYRTYEATDKERSKSWVCRRCGERITEVNSCYCYD